MLDGGFMKWQYDGFDVEPRESNAKKVRENRNIIFEWLLVDIINNTNNNIILSQYYF